MPKPRSQSRASKFSAPERPGRAVAAASAAAVPASPAPPRDDWFARILDQMTVRRIVLAFILIQVVFLPLACYIGSRKAIRPKVNEALAARDWSAAADGLRQLAGRGAGGARASLDLARCLLEMNRPDEALQALDRLGTATARTLSTIDATELRALRAWARMRQGQSDAPLAELQDILKAQPDHPMANAVMGRHLLDQGKPLEAAPFFAKLANRLTYAEHAAAFHDYLEANLLVVPAEELADLPEQVEVPGSEIPAAGGFPAPPADLSVGKVIPPLPGAAATSPPVQAPVPSSPTMR